MWLELHERSDWGARRQTLIGRFLIQRCVRLPKATAYIATFLQGKDKVIYQYI